MRKRRLYLWLIRVIGVIVPRRLRPDWRQEWEAELRWREAQLAEWEKLNGRSKLALLWHSAGAFVDALLLQPKRVEDEIMQDILFGVRMLLKRPGFTLIAVATLALGIGVNTALFTGFNLVLRPWPINDPDSVVSIEFQRGSTSRNFSYPDYEYLRDHAQAFSDLLPSFEEKILLGEKAIGQTPEEIHGTFVSDKHLSALGGTTLLGRFFTSEENRVAGRDAVLVLSYPFWQRRFAGNPQIIGKKLLLNGQPFTVIGVTSPNFVGLRMEMPDLWLPLMMRSALATVYFEEIATENRDWFGKQDFQWLSLHARLKPGQTIAAAQAEINGLYRQLPRQMPTNQPQDTIQLAQLTRTGPQFWLVMAAVLGASGLVLLIACSNIANMLLARAAARQKEISIRLALGASRWRVVRQLLTESFLLAALGGIAGVVLAWWSVKLLLPWAMTRSGGGDMQRLMLNLSPDWRVLSFAFLLSLLSGAVFGLLPALRATRPDLIAVIKDDSAAFGGRLARSWLRNGLVVAQVALCLVLLIPAGLLLRGLTKVLSTDPGFETKKLLIMYYSLELSGYDNARAQLFQQQLRERLRGVAGVERISSTSEFGGRATIILPSEVGANEKQFEGAPFRWIPAEYLETVGTPVIQGRGFTAEEVQAKAPVVIVSESTARNLWPNENPLGKTFRAERRLRNGTTQIELPSAQVIGVARDAQTWNIGEIPSLFFYAPYTPTELLDTLLLVRTTRDAAAMKELVRKEAYALEPLLRLDTVTMEERIAHDNKVTEARSASDLATALGSLALLLAAIGIYGVMAFSVAQRTREIGIRMALGAPASNVQRLVIQQAMTLVLLGLLIGVPISIGVTQVMKSMLFGLSATDPATYSSVALLLALVALLACWMPARRAAKVDPMIALRSE